MSGQIGVLSEGAFINLRTIIRTATYTHVQNSINNSAFFIS